MITYWVRFFDFKYCNKVRPLLRTWWISRGSAKRRNRTVSRTLSSSASSRMSIFLSKKLSDLYNLFFLYYPLVQLKKLRVSAAVHYIFSDSAHSVREDLRNGINIHTAYDTWSIFSLQHFLCVLYIRVVGTLLPHCSFFFNEVLTYFPFFFTDVCFLKWSKNRNKCKRIWT